MNGNWKNKNSIIKKVMWLGFTLLFLNGSIAVAERPTDTNVLNFLVNQGKMGFSDSGAALLPQAVLLAMRNGKVSPAFQLVLYNQILTQAARNAMYKYPQRREPVAMATTKFIGGMCMIQKAIQQLMIIALFPQLSSATHNGGSADATDRQSAQQMALMFAQAFKKSGPCNNAGGSDGGIDPMLIQIIAGQQ